MLNNFGLLVGLLPSIIINRFYTMIHIKIDEEFVEALKEFKNVLDKKISDETSSGIQDTEDDFVGFECPNEFIVGYGMDFAGLYRGLLFIGVLKPEAYV